MIDEVKTMSKKKAGIVQNSLMVIMAKDTDDDGNDNDNKSTKKDIDK